MSELQAELEIEASSVSQQLAVLRAKNVVDTRAREPASTIRSAIHDLSVDGRRSRDLQQPPDRSSGMLETSPRDADFEDESHSTVPSAGRLLSVADAAPGAVYFGVAGLERATSRIRFEPLRVMVGRTISLGASTSNWGHC